jgi:hypothetical protein
MFQPERIEIKATGAAAGSVDSSASELFLVSVKGAVSE